MPHREERSFRVAQDLINPGLPLTEKTAGPAAIPPAGRIRVTSETGAISTLRDPPIVQQGHESTIPARNPWAPTAAAILHHRSMKGHPDPKGEEPTVAITLHLPGGK